MSPLHSVRLDEDLCRGCTNCLKTCPTEAIRVKNGKAFIIEDRCVDCGACIRRCPFRAKKAHSDSLPIIGDYDFAVALPAPALYGQFPKGTRPDDVLEGLVRLGFDACVEVAFAAEAVTRATCAYRESRESEESLISSSCPAVVRLIRNRFPDLLDRVIPLRSPMEIAASLARERFRGAGERVGVFFVSPCAAKVTAVRDPLGHEDSAVDGVIGFKEIWRPLFDHVTDVTREAARGNPPPIRSESGFRGVSWARSEGEAEGAGLGETLAADGIQAVLEALEALEDDRLDGIGFLELMACPGGCVGGPLAVENPYLARSRIRAIEEERRAEAASAGVSGVTGAESRRAAGGIGDARRPADGGVPDDAWRRDDAVGRVEMGFTAEITSLEVFSLDDDYGKAVEMMAEMDALCERLPGLDCGSCGSPSCRALAEDIVRGYAKETDCVFRLRDRIRDLTEEMLELEDLHHPGPNRAGDGSVRNA